MYLQEYSKLKEQNEELQGQVLSSHYQEGRRLLQAGASFAQELENLPKDEVCIDICNILKCEILSSFTWFQ